MVSKLSEKVLIKAKNKAFRTAVIRKIDQLCDAVNVGVVWDNKVDADRKHEAVNKHVESIDLTQSIAFVTLAESGQIDNVTAGEHIELFDEWKYPINYKVGQLRRHNDKLYKCISKHTSEETWTPDVSPSLWVIASDPAEEFPEWSQPTGEPDSYDKGDKVTHNGKHWISDYDANTWEPGVFGWAEIPE